ncbi:hypothetical protein JHV675_53980 [Mycobacterium avium subsp. hominissuis]
MAAHVAPAARSAAMRSTTDDGTPTGQGGSQWFPNTVARIAKRAVAVPAT